MIELGYRMRDSAPPLAPLQVPLMSEAVGNRESQANRVLEYIKDALRAYAIYEFSYLEFERYYGAASSGRIILPNRDHFINAEANSLSLSVSIAGNESPQVKIQCNGLSNIHSLKDGYRES